MSVSVYVCVSLSAIIAPEPHARSLSNNAHVAYGRGSLTKFQGKGAILVVFFSTDNALYSMHSIWDPWTHTKTTKPTEMQFGMISGLDPRNSVLGASDGPRRGRAIFGESMYPTSLKPLLISNWAGPCSGTRQHRRLIASVGRVYYRLRSGGWDCTLRTKSDIYDCLVRD